MFPAAGGVATFAGFLESALVRIDMTSSASTEAQVLKAGPARGGIGLVAILAGHFAVQSGQRKARLGVIKFAGGFPGFERMALQAVVAEAAFVRIAMAGGAVGRLAEEGFAEIFHFDEIATGGKHVRRGVALRAGCGGVFGFEFVAGEIVIELLWRGRPLNQVGGLAVVLQVAAHAVSAVWITHLHLKVVAVLG